MYYPQQSPGISHKLPNHHEQSPWNRYLVAAGSQANIGPLPSSSGYALYPNGNVNTVQHHPGHHPLTHPPMQHHPQPPLSHYPSPPNGVTHQPHILSQGSPASVSSQVITKHRQDQLFKYETIRSLRSPHHRARASAMASRTVAKSVIPITNPNATNKITLEAIDSTASDIGNGSPPNNSRDETHPSSTVAPVSVAPRPTALEVPESNWNSLDMGGVNIKTIPQTSGLFSFKFLLHLYLNHNALESIPAEISRLRHLHLLDLSANQLRSIPPELGMLTQLTDLYLFDNHLTTLPYELGTLHQLTTLGIEGNPLDASLKAIVQKDGTTALIAYLRDNCPPMPPPQERLWTSLLTQPESEALQADPKTESFVVLSYNILCKRCATERLYGYTPSWALSWDYRKELIFNELLKYDADFLCLQEVDIAQYEEYFTKNLEERGYEGVFWAKPRYQTLPNEADRRQVDGCATFFKSSRYQLVEKQLIQFNTVAMQRQDFKKTDDMFNRVLGKEHLAVMCLLEDKETGTRLIVANAHIHWNPAFRDVKLVQVALLVEEIEKAADSFAKYPPRLSQSAGAQDSVDAQHLPVRLPPVYTDGLKIPVILCGDFNSGSASGVYEFLANGSLAPDHEDFMSHMYGRYTSEGLRHKLNLKNAHATPGPGDLTLTNFTPSFQGTLDYIWFSAPSLTVNAVLGGVDKNYLEKCVGFPNAHFPSDHVSVVGEFRVKPQRDAQRPVPVNVSA